jgi:hypothetical protein
MKQKHNKDEREGDVRRNGKRIGYTDEEME